MKVSAKQSSIELRKTKKKLASVERRLTRLRLARQVRRHQNIARRFVGALEKIADNFFRES